MLNLDKAGKKTRRQSRNSQSQSEDIYGLTLREKRSRVRAKGTYKNRETSLSSRSGEEGREPNLKIKP